MFLQLAHTKLDVFKFSHDLTLECYRITKQFSTGGKFALVQQIRRAALPVQLNIAEGCSGKPVAERKRYFEIAGGSVIEIDTATGIAHKLSYSSLKELQPPGDLIIRTFKILSGMIG